MRKERKHGISDPLSIWWFQVENEPISVLLSIFSVLQSSSLLPHSFSLFCCTSRVQRQNNRGYNSSLSFPHLSHPIYLNISQGYLFFKCQHSQAIAWAIEIMCEFTSIWFCSLQIHAKLNWSFQMQKQCYSQN